VKIWLKIITLNAAKSTKIEEIVVAEKIRDNKFTTSFKADVILCMRK